MQWTIKKWNTKYGLYLFVVGRLENAGDKGGPPIVPANNDN